MKHTYSIGIDIGGTNTDMGLVRDDGTIIARSNIPTNAYTVFEPYIHDIMEHISTMMKNNDVQQLEGIGIGAPNGNFYTGCVDNAPNLTIKGVLDFGKEIHKYMDTTVVLSNDANAAAFGEMVYGGAKGMKHFIMFTLGTGVGSGIVVDGKLVHGSTGAAGELGHNILFPEGRMCSCGRKGCLEAYTSARGIVQTFCELRKENGPRECKQGWIPDNVPDSDVSSKMIGDAANAGDPIAIATYEKTGYWLGLAIANSVTFSAPEAIFLMGGPTKVGEPLLKPLRESFEKHLLNIFQGSCSIRMSELKANEVAILGAAALIKMKE
ncbi:MAG: ROK family protein [Bacteroidales bacterium]|nr:ROK family protein [Bacteroidales bacterium]